MPETEHHIVETNNAYVDAQHDPFLYIYMRGVPGKTDYDALAGYFEHVIAEDMRNVFLFDLRDVEKLKFVEIVRSWLPWARKHKKRVGELFMGIACLTDHTMVIKVMNAIFNVMPVALPLQIFRDKHDAIEWLYHLAEQTNLDLPEERVWEDI